MLQICFRSEFAPRFLGWQTSTHDRSRSLFLERACEVLRNSTNLVREFSRTRWGAALDGDEMIAVALEYSGMTPQPMFVMGRDDGIEAILRDVVRPRAAYVAALTESLPAVQAQYKVDPGPPMLMSVGAFDPGSAADVGPAQRHAIRDVLR